MSAHQEMNEFAPGEARFATPDYAFGKEPNYFLKSCRRIVPRHGRALAVADGEGRNGVWLAEQGLDVVSLDFSPAAQNKAWALAAERGVKVTFVRADVHVWDYPQTAFDVVVEILYTRGMLEQAFGDCRDVRVIEEEREMREGASHAGMSAVIGLTAIKP